MHHPAVFLDASAVRVATARVPHALAGALTPSELASLLARSQAALCNNSGPARLAAAIGAPVVVACALINPQHTPWRTRARALSQYVPCRYCLRSLCLEGHDRCLLGVPADEIAAAALDLMRAEVTA
jgi:ADP-heptose:LPS heptosyltransferase